MLTFDRSRWLFALLAGVLAVYGLVGAWLVTAGPTDPVQHTADFLAYLVSPWMLATYALTGVFLGFGAWRLRQRPTVATETSVEKTLARRALQFASVLLVSALALSGIAYLYLRDLERTSLADRTAEQKLVARFKAQQISKWLVENKINAEIMATSMARMPIDRLPGDRDVAQVVGLLFAEALAGNPERTALTLFAPNGTVLVHEGEGAAPAPEIVAAARVLAGNPAAPRVVDLFEEPSLPGKPRMGLLMPLPGSGTTMSPVLAITLDPFRTILANFAAWPTPSTTSEVLLVHRVGDDAVFIVPPSRLSPAPAPNSFRLPLSNTRLPAAQILLQGPGPIRMGIDYMGTPVFAASDAVVGLPWVVGAKTDESELVGPLRKRARTLAAVILAGILLGAVCLWVLYRGERSALLAQAEQAKREHEALSRHLEGLTRLARDIVFLVDEDRRVVEANDAAIAAYGFSREELFGMKVVDLRPADERAKFDADWERYLGETGALVETVHRRKDGSTFPVEISSRPIDVGGRRYVQSFIRDISQRKVLERQVARLSRVRTALQAATSALLRARSDSEIYERLCAILVREGGYVMTNVCMPNDDPAKSVRFAAVAGRDEGYLAQAQISWGDGPRGQGPTGRALREGTIQVNQDFVSNPVASLWRDDALKRGYRSSISLPLRDGDRTFGVLTLYAGERDAFDDDEVALLSNLSADLAYAARAAESRKAA